MCPIRAMSGAQYNTSLTVTGRSWHGGVYYQGSTAPSAANHYHAMGVDGWNFGDSGSEHDGL